ncbi:conserved hypothetical protein [Denitrovibrio acetiphilus DSM 12809]|uniref:N(2)-fixation sustaining protein CowN n=1 Tax=Denitrovibrio acetiphilus (strain DSM 12809 / NBRC 114555 / N2460) TaxID=522772 RepID=COWN_DENA2|nr:N(2)-fixation sustaining protein CowN [Denitrovibrio acetiphilus]D4H539.1 RecName: Full=N(2)-fixation sustaining protein CowN; AltName: Full=CO weal-nitrogenase [Denitrovibrio acetiphilus DSM 12809]ADD69395.1 conserved hypothetical protein [Denitrovibrio acetiphilus DSM 12809]
MCNCKKNIKVDESYVSFKDIDCFENACLVIDNLLRILKEPKNTNAYWEKFIEKIPEAYYTRDSKKDPSEALLYLVCSCTSNIMELFEEIDDEEAIDAMSKCEQECC